VYNALNFVLLEASFRTAASDSKQTMGGTNPITIMGTSGEMIQEAVSNASQTSVVVGDKDGN